MTITLNIEVPDTGNHNIIVAVVEKPVDPTLADQHCEVRREIHEIQNGVAVRK